MSVAAAVLFPLAWGALAAARPPDALEAPGAEGLPPRAAVVELRIPPGADEAAIRDLVAVVPGAPVGARALRRTAQLLYQSGRCRNVIVRERPAPPPEGERGVWAAIEIECLAARTLRTIAVRVQGPPAIDVERLRSVAGLKTGEPFDDPDLEAAAARIRAEYARRGYRAAEVNAVAVGDLEVAVELAVRPGAPTRVAALRLIGDPGPAAAQAVGGLRTRQGEVLVEEALADDVKRLRSALWEAGYRRARVGLPAVREGPGGAEVEIPVDSGPRMRFVFRGVAEVHPAELEKQLGFEEGQPVDAPAVDAAAERLRDWYRARAFAAVRVEVEERRRDGLLEVIFHVDEGRRYRVGQVRIEGPVAHDLAAARARLAAILAEATGPPESAGVEAERLLAVSLPSAPRRRSPPVALPAGDHWDGAAWDRAAERLAETWRADGWLEAEYMGGHAELDARRGVVDVLLRFREGPLVRVESIAFEGNASVSLPLLARESRLAPGDPVSFQKIEETRVAILRLYLARGHLYARVEHAVDRERPAVVRYVVEEGPKVRIGRIVINGNRRTREDVVRRALTVSEGQIYDPEAVSRTQSALLRLGVFRSVGLRLQDPETPQETKDLAVELSERPWQTVGGGVGFSIANGPRAVVEYGQPNVLGRALELSARGKVNYPLEVFRPDLAEKPPAKRIEGRAELGLRQPRLEYLPVPLGARTDAIVERLHRRAYDLTRVSGILGTDVGLTSRVSFTLQYEAEVDQIAKSAALGPLTQADLERLRFDEGVTTLHGLRPSLTLDFRDNSAHPHRGWFASGTAEVAHSIGTPGERLLLGLVPGSDIHTNMMKMQGTLSGYMPVGASVLALSLRSGRVFPLDSRSRTIVPKRFFLGGASSMRGYAEDEMIQEDVRAELEAEARHCASTLSRLGCTQRGLDILAGKIPISEGGEAFLLVKSELRFTLRGSIEAGLFVDVGNLWLDPIHLSVMNLRTNVGLGLRFVTPAGPAAVDLGFNVMPDTALNERTVAPHLSIGLF